MEARDISKTSSLWLYGRDNEQKNAMLSALVVGKHALHFKCHEIHERLKKYGSAALTRSARGYDVVVLHDLYPDDNHTGEHMAEVIAEWIDDRCQVIVLSVCSLAQYARDQSVLIEDLIQMVYV